MEIKALPFHTETIVGGVCKLVKTCCSRSAEVSFQAMSAGDYKQKIQTMLASALMPCHNHTFLSTLFEYKIYWHVCHFLCRERERERERERGGVSWCGS